MNRFKTIECAKIEVNEMEGYFLTDCGKVREMNEDAGGVFFNKAKQCLAIVADGMGGHQAGEIASDLAVRTVRESYEKTKEFRSISDAEQWLDEMIIKMNEQVYNYALQDDNLKGMGTTVVLSLCTKEFVIIGHVGDSRCYLWNDETHLSQITSDHSLVNELVKTGQISAVDAEEHPRKNVLIKAVGTDMTITPDIKTIEWKGNDRLLLCSDGLSNKVTDDELAEALKSMDRIDETANQLIELANERGGEDNITLAIVRNKEGEST